VGWALVGVEPDDLRIEEVQPCGRGATGWQSLGRVWGQTLEQIEFEVYYLRFGRL